MPAQKPLSPFPRHGQAAVPTFFGRSVKELGRAPHNPVPSPMRAGRIDNQYGAGRGDRAIPVLQDLIFPWEDDLLRIFGGERITNIMDKLGMEEGEPIEHNLISKAIENAQSKVEGHNFDIRKHLLEYDDVMNQQREVIYRQRREALTGKDLKPSIEGHDI